MVYSYKVMGYKQQLQSIISATGWSQEEAARHLDVSFATFNSWINGRSVPRKRSQNKIQNLFTRVVGSEQIDETQLTDAIAVAESLSIDPKSLVKDTQALEKLVWHLTYHTNTIEGSTMTLADVSDVIFDDKVLANRSAVEQLEARNHQAAFYWLVDQVVSGGAGFRLSSQLITDLHVRLMNGIVSDAGQYRTHAVRIMGAHVPLANYAKIPQLVQELCAEVNTRQSESTVRLMAESHAKFEQIHPFSDGNGRTGRLLMLAQALRAGLVPPLVAKERKYAYYKYLELAQVSGEHRPLVQFVAESMVFTAELLSVDTHQSSGL
jgi:Fic family protein